MNMKKISGFFTKDLYLAAYIYSQDVKLLQLQKDISANFLWFIFDDNEQCKKLEEKFWSKQALVNLHTYLDGLKTLKQRLFQNVQKENY
jgi:hypothetical protein